MKTIWSAQGLDCGRLVHRIPFDANLNTMDVGTKAGRLYIVSFGRVNGENEYSLVSLADGMQCIKAETLDALAEKMNQSDYHPLSGSDKDKVIELAAKVAVTPR